MRAGVCFPEGSDLCVKPMLLNLDRANCSYDHPFAHISWEVFHLRFCEPLTPRETVDLLATILEELGWIRKASGTGTDSSIELDNAIEATMGVTTVLHTKYVSSIWFTFT